MKNRCSFDNFMIYDGNRTTCELLAGLPATTARQNAPVFLNGPSGSGKTHLLFSLQNAMDAQGRPALYQTCDDCVSAMITSIQQERQEAFCASYAVYHTLILDDIQTLSKKHSTVEEVFRFIEKIREGTQVVLAGSLVLDDGTYGAHFVQRFKSYFSDGIVTELRLPNHEERSILLERQLCGNGVVLSAGKVSKMARKKLTMRHIEGVANSIDAGRLL